MKKYETLDNIQEVKLFDNFSFKLTKRQRIIQIKKRIIKLLQIIGIKK